MPRRRRDGKRCQQDRGGAPTAWRYVGGMLRVAVSRSRIATRTSRRQVTAIFATAVVLAPVATPPAAAFDLLATHEVTAQFATADGKPMADAEVRVFAPGKPNTPVETGRTDAAGKFVFDADRDGMWSAEARTANEVARVTIRVGRGAARNRWRNPLAVIGALGVLLVVALWYRLRQIGPRRPKR
jgi:hypothetical protein